VLGVQLNWTQYEISVFSAEEQSALNLICEKYDVSPEMMSKLIELELSLQGMSRRASAQRKLSAVMEEDWRTNKELFQVDVEGASTCS
jgi:DNA sulfur modification protein DndC